MSDMTFHRLDEGRVCITGVTGLVGQAVLQRILSDHPAVEVVCLVRGRRHESGSQRVRRLLSKPCFRAWREREGVERVEQIVRDRVEVIEADLAEGVPALPPDLRALIHCAADVSFDKPTDESLGTNLRGSVNLLTAACQSGSCPHFVHVSTAFVAGFRKGLIPETRLAHEVDWRQELASALAAREAAELSSRSPAIQERILRDARRSDQAVGPQAVVALAEKLRAKWVHEQLVTFGRIRARALGWPDSYTFSKALGERALEESASSASDPLPLSIVRPSIIESALAQPYAGWSDGFKMSGPLIVAFGYGLLAEQPMLPDGAVDFVPVDLVVSALLAVAANPSEPGCPVYYHVGSSARNPLTGKQLVGHITEYFRRYPLAGTDGGGPVSVPQRRFVPIYRAERGLRMAERLVSAAQQTVLQLGPSDRSRKWIDAIGKQEARLGVLRRLADLYGPYLDVEAAFCDRRTAALHLLMPAEEQQRAGFDVAVVDWSRYLVDVHFPSVTAQLRALDQRGPARPRVRRSLELPENRNVAAVFDLEGTLLASNVVEAYLWTRLLGRPRSAWGGELAAILGSMPRYLALQHRGRAEFLRDFAQRYRGVNEAELRRLVDEQLGDLLLERAWPQALRRVRKHRAAGHQTVLVTGAIEAFVEPFEPLFDEVSATRLEVVDGRITGFLLSPPLVGEARASWLRQWAQDNGIDLTRSYGYADHYSDRAFLEAVGNPVAVNPDARLYRYARRSYWPVELWCDHVQSALDALAVASHAEVSCLRGRR
jgi:alcohol-forming fatty acyl-CoA reductase